MTQYVRELTCPQYSRTDKLIITTSAEKVKLIGKTTGNYATLIMVMLISVNCTSVKLKQLKGKVAKWPLKWSLSL